MRELLKNKYLVIAALMGALGIALGAFGAHGLKKILEPKALANWNTASDYWQLHSLFLLGLSLKIKEVPKLILAFHLGWIGTFLFSGSLFAYCFFPFKPLVFITPIGGVFLILAWLALGRAAK